MSATTWVIATCVSCFLAIPHDCHALFLSPPPLGMASLLLAHVASHYVGSHKKGGIIKMPKLHIPIAVGRQVATGWLGNASGSMGQVFATRLRECIFHSQQSWYARLLKSYNHGHVVTWSQWQQAKHILRQRVLKSTPPSKINILKSCIISTYLL